MSFGLGGLASGIDTATVIDRIMALERRKSTQIKGSQTKVQARQDALKDITTRLKALRSAAAELRAAATWGEVQKVETSDATKVGATQVSGAAPGGFQVGVTQLARAAQKTFTYTANAAATTLTIGAISVDVAANSTVDTVASTINGRSDSPVVAANVSGQLVLSAKTTGAATTVSASGTTIAEDVPKAVAGLDANYTVDGVAKTSASNITTNGIAGVELTLKAVTASAVTVNVGAPAVDQVKIKDKLKAFVEQYNSTVDQIRNKLAEKPVRDAANDVDRRKGALVADSMLSGLLARLRTAVSDTVAGNPATIDEFAEIGVSSGASTGSNAISKDNVSGRLKLDEAKLASALSSDLGGVKRLLGAVSGVDGFAQRFEAVIAPLTDGGGTLESRVASDDSLLASLRTRLTDTDRRLSGKEAALRKQFAAMESALSQSQTQGAWLSAQLSRLR